MMNKQRFSVVYEKFTSKDILPKGIMDNKNNNHMCRIEEVCEVLNEQQATISKLEEENEQLRKELDNFKPVMFQDMRKGTVILYSKGVKDE